METRRSGQQCLLTVGHFNQETVKIHKYCFRFVALKLDLNLTEMQSEEKEAERTKAGDKERDGREKSGQELGCVQSPVGRL